MRVVAKVVTSMGQVKVHEQHTMDDSRCSYAPAQATQTCSVHCLRQALFIHHTF